MIGIKFKDFLLNESKVQLGRRISDILNAMQDLTQNTKSMGTRQVNKNSEKIVNQIRRILHTNWPKVKEDNLKPLQKQANRLWNLFPQSKEELYEIWKEVH